MVAKKLLAIITAFLVLLTSSALCETAALGDTAQLVLDTVKWSTAFPKDAQVVQACEYFCKVEGQQLRVVLAEVTQQELLLNILGGSGRLLLIDMDSDLVLTHQNFTEPDYSNIATHEDALKLLFNSYFSYVAYGAEFIYSDAEMLFPISDDEIAAINNALTAYFTPQQ